MLSCSDVARIVSNFKGKGIVMGIDEDIALRILETTGIPAGSNLTFFSKYRFQR